MTLTFVFSQVSDYLSLWKSARSWKPFKVTYLFFSRVIFHILANKRKGWYFRKSWSRKHLDYHSRDWIQFSDKNILIITAKTIFCQEYLDYRNNFLPRMSWLFRQEYPPSCNKLPTGRSSAYSLQTILFLRGLIFSKPIFPRRGFIIGGGEGSEQIANVLVSQKLIEVWIKSSWYNNPAMKTFLGGKMDFSHSFLD